MKITADLARRPPTSPVTQRDSDFEPRVAPADSARRSVLIAEAGTEHRSTTSGRVPLGFGTKRPPESGQDLISSAREVWTWPCRCTDSHPAGVAVCAKDAMAGTRRASAPAQSSSPWRLRKVSARPATANPAGFRTSGPRGGRAAYLALRSRTAVHDQLAEAPHRGTRRQRHDAPVHRRTLTSMPGCNARP